jgi:hypothetical protein
MQESCEVDTQGQDPLDLTQPNYRVQQIHEAIDQGKPMAVARAIDPHLFDNYRLFFWRQRLANLKPRAGKEPTTVILLVGPDGCGKTHMCRERWPDAYFRNLTTWDEYQGQTTVVLEGMDSDEDTTITALIRWMSNHPAAVRVPGISQAQLQATTLVLTARSPPHEWPVLHAAKAKDADKFRKLLSHTYLLEGRESFSYLPKPPIEWRILLGKKTKC